MTTKEQEGYELAKGAIGYLARIMIIGFIALAAFALLRNSLGWGVDDSDRSGWQRSGLRIHTDAKTGVQYLSDGNGGLVRRDDR